MELRDRAVSGWTPPNLRGLLLTADRYTEWHWAPHPCSGQPTIAVRDFVQVLLVVILGQVDRPGGGDLGGDGAEAGAPQGGVVRFVALLRGGLLLGAGGEDGRAVLGAEVV